MRLGVLTNYVTDGVDATVASAVAAAIKHLSAAGALVEDVRFAPLDRLPEINRFGFVADRGVRVAPAAAGRARGANTTRACSCAS